MGIRCQSADCLGRAQTCEKHGDAERKTEGRAFPQRRVARLSDLCRRYTGGEGSLSTWVCAGEKRLRLFFPIFYASVTGPPVVEAFFFFFGQSFWDLVYFGI